MRYASQTDVPSDRSRAEIERTLTRYGADAFAYGWDDQRATLGFRIDGLRVRFELPLPDREKFTRTPTGKKRNNARSIENAYEQGVRQRWRALALIIKAKLEAVESGITTLPEEFLAQTVLPDGRTFGAWAIPQVKQSYIEGRMPPLLPGPSEE